MSSSDLVALVGGVAWSNWTAYRVESDFLIASDSWQLEAANPTASQVAAVVEGSAITLMMGATTVLTGWVDQKRLSRSRAGTTMTLSGRDSAAPLTDCSAPLSWSLRNASLAGVAQQALTALGIAMTVEATAEAAELAPRVQVEPGDTYWEVLDRLARASKLMLWSTPGVLHIGRPTYTSAPVGALVLSRTIPSATNVLSADHAWTVSGRRSPVTVVSQAGGSDSVFGGSVRIRGEATDAAVTALGLTRPLVMLDADASTAAKAKARAEWEVSRRAGEAWVGTVEVVGNGPAEGQVWTPDTVVTMDDDLAGISGPVWICARALTRSREQGTRTTLTLRALNAILPPV